MKTDGPLNSRKSRPRRVRCDITDIAAPVSITAGKMIQLHLTFLVVKCWKLMYKRGTYSE